MKKRAQGREEAEEFVLHPLPFVPLSLSLSLFLSACYDMFDDGTYGLTSFRDQALENGHRRNIARKYD